MSIPISTGSGAASVAAEAVGGLQYQQIQILGQGGGSTLGVNPDASLNTSIIGVPNVRFANSSILAVPVGSVITLNQGSSILAIPVGSTIAVLQSSSILSVPVGSTIGVWQAASIAGTYAEDAAHTSADRGVFTLAVRNDTLPSVTSADGDYSQVTVGPAGEVITQIAPFNGGIQGTADLRVVQGASVTVIAAQGATIFSYIKTVQLANMGSASVLVTLSGGLGSILAYTIAPAGGGSNIKYDPWLKTGANSAFTASISGTASVLVSAQGFIAKI
jgi:hypothetical protein